MYKKCRPSAPSRLRRALGVAGLSTALLLGSAGASTAATWSHNDPTKDVVSYGYDDEDAEDYTAEATRAAGDIQRIAVSHQRSKLVVRLNFRQGLPKDNWSIYEAVRTPRAEFMLFAGRTDGYGGISLYKVSPRFKKVACKVSIKYATRSIQVTIPSNCLGRPKAVKVGAGIETEAGDRAYADDALQRGVRDDIRLSPMIRRG